MTEGDLIDVKYFESLVDGGLELLDQGQNILWNNTEIKNELRPDVQEYINKLQELRTIRNKIVNKSTRLTTIK